MRLSETKEIVGLQGVSVYEILCSEDFPDSANALGVVFVLVIKNIGKKEEMYNARFVVGGHTDAKEISMCKNLPIYARTEVRCSSHPLQYSTSGCGLKKFRKRAFRTPKNFRYKY